MISIFEFLKWFVIIGGVLFGFSGWGSDFQSPRTGALGGAGHAAPYLSDAIYLNPSYLSLSPAHALALNYLGYQTGSPPSSGGNLNISGIYSEPDLVAQWGAALTQRLDGNLLHVAVSSQMAERFSVGVGSKFYFSNTNSGILADLLLSMTFVPLNWFRFSIITDNLLESIGGSVFSREFGLGTRFSLNSLYSLLIDSHFNPTLQSIGLPLWGYELGVEYNLLEYFFLRVGGGQNSTLSFLANRGDTLALGIGASFPRFSFDYSYVRVLSSARTFSHQLGVVICF